MKKLPLLMILAFTFLVAGCWDNEKEKRAQKFMSGLAKCDNCEIKRPLFEQKKHVDDEAEEKSK